MSGTVAFLVAHPAVAAGLGAALFVFVIGAFIGTSMAKQSDTPVRWFSSALVAAVAAGLLVAGLAGGVL